MYEAINAQQKTNVIKAFNKTDTGHDYLDDIAKSSEQAKLALCTLFGERDTLVFSRAKSAEELEKQPVLAALIAKHTEHSFSFVSKTVTERATGACKSISKLLDKHETAQVNAICNEPVMLVLSCNPFFLIGSSVRAQGDQLDNSCHYIGQDYSSGSISYALDNCTVTAAVWSDTGLTGRMLVHIDSAAIGIVTSRRYGNFSEADSSFIRKEIYKMFLLYPAKDWKKTSDYSFNTRGYQGYQDNSLYQGYRPATSSASYTLVAPICPDCGEEHSEERISCCNDERYTCDECGERISEDHTMSYNGDGCYCEYCWSELFFYCGDCGSEYSIRETEQDGGTCEHCLRDKGYIKCDDCGNWSDEYTIYNDEALCSSCLPAGEQCSDCGEYFATGDYITTDDNYHYCHDCKDSNATECQECQVYHRDRYMNETADSAMLCDSCLDTLIPCIHCGSTFYNTPLSVYNPVCSEECARAMLFWGC